MRIKAILRRPAVWAVTALDRLSGRRAGVVVAYHRVGESDPRDSLDHVGLSLPRATFEAQLRLLKRRYRVVPASELEAAVRARRRFERLPASITFDDDSPTHARTAAPILARLGLPATFFVCGASLHEPHSFWWERMERALARNAVDEQWLREAVPRPAGQPDECNERDMREIAADVELMPARERDAFSDELRRRAGPDPEDAGLREADLSALCSAGLEVGFHTARHYNLTLLDDRSLADAMREGRDEIERIAGGHVDTIAYPGGRADERVAAAARAAGFVHGFTVSRVPVLPDSDPLLLGRFSVPNDLAPGRFELMVARILRQAPAGAQAAADDVPTTEPAVAWSRGPAIAAPWLIAAALIFVLLWIGVGVGA